VIVAAPIGSVDHVRAVLAPELPADVVLGVVEGGATRQDSVASALAAVPAHYAIVLVHDAARAFAPPDLIERVAAAVRNGHEAVIPVLPVIDTIKQVDESGYVYATPDRTSLRAVQTPQGFRRDILAAAHQAASGTATDDAALAERIGAKVFCVAGAEAALKITRPADLATAERLRQAATLGS
jgi:2-C-methyl-D-erythritol 4-phosphate cytidylyltransferase